METKLGEGSTFHIYLPAVRDQIPPEPARSDGILRGRGRVLAMDDDGSLRLVLRMMLKHLGYEPTLATEGGEVLELYRQAQEAGQPFDVVLMDLSVEDGMDGFEATQRLLEMDPRARVIVVTGHSDAPAAADYRQAGFAANIRKPFDVRHLGQVLHQVLRGECGII